MEMSERNFRWQGKGLSLAQEMAIFVKIKHTSIKLYSCS